MKLFKSKEKEQETQSVQPNSSEQSVNPPPISAPPTMQPVQPQPVNLKKFKPCRKCKQYIPKKVSKCPYCRSSQGISCSGMLGAFVFVIVAFFIFNAISKNNNQSPRVSQTDSIPPIEEYAEMCETIDYETLSRNPDKYKGKDFKFTGEVIQVVESGNGQVDLRINVTKGDYFWSDTIYATVNVPKGRDRILESDIITIYGKCEGLYTYQSVLGAKVSLPLIKIYYYSIK